MFKPLKHQQDYLDKHGRDKSWGLFWEQGTAKTKPCLDTAALLFEDGSINGLLVVAPPGVERNWASDEIPKHMSEDVLAQTKVGIFLTAKKHTKNHKQLMKNLVLHSGLAILLISYPAFMTKEGKNIVWKFLKERRCLYVLDESHNIKTPKAKRTKSIIASGRYAPYKRILTGTPISMSPFDVYTQIKFLDEHFWKQYGMYTAATFRNYFAEWFTREQCQIEKGYDPGYNEFKEYKNLDKLEVMLESMTDRVTKDQVLDLPPKLYSKRYFDINAEQLAIYNELKNQFMYEFEDGDVVDGLLPIVRLLRFQQITCNYIPGEEYTRQISDKNPRLEVMEAIRDETHTPTIVWARFRHDVDQIMDMLGGDAVRYDGSVTADAAERGKQAFQNGECQWFVGTAQKGGPGLTLHAAKNVVYYSNSFRLVDRLQSEDRAHRVGMDNDPVNYIDIVANNVPIDNSIVDNLRAKKDIADIVLKDSIKEWI